MPASPGPEIDMNRLRSAVAAACAGALLVPFAPMREAAAASDIVISQFYTPGGEAGAAYKNDYVELFNRGTTAIDVTGWTLQYRLPPVLEWSALANLSGTIVPGGYYLIRLAGNAAGNGAELPPADAVPIFPDLAIGNVRGSLVLVASSQQYFCSPSTPAVDRVTYGATVCPEGTEIAAPGALAALRVDNGCTDSDNNVADFTTGTPTPRNSASPVLLCAVLEAADREAAAALRLGPAHPNPSATTTGFSFAVGRDGPVRCGIFDPRGRRVRLLVDGWLPAGEHRVTWDGRDTDGSAVPAGVYLARFEAPRERARETLRFVRVR